MKKFLFVITLFSFIISLCSCGGYREIERGYIVTALGFDKKSGDKLTVSAEVVSAGGNERANAPYSEILEGEGVSPGEALFLLNNEISKELFFEHCSAVILGDGLSEEQTKEIFVFLKNLRELNKSLSVAATENSKMLLNNSKSVSIAKGFDIERNINESRKETGENYQNSFYEVDKLYTNGEIYALPELKLEQKKIIVSGEAVYKRNEKKIKLDAKESLIYSILKGNNRGGRFYIDKAFGDVIKFRIKNEKNSLARLDVYVKRDRCGFEKTLQKNTDKFLKKHKNSFENFPDEVKVKVRRSR